MHDTRGGERNSRGGRDPRAAATWRTLGTAPPPVAGENSKGEERAFRLEWNGPCWIWCDGLLCVQEMDRSGEEHAKIVEMDMGRSSCSVAASESREQRRRAEYYGQCSPAPSSAAFTELMSHSGHFEEDLEPATARVASPYYVPADDGESVSEFCPNYMANTQSSRAKARSQSAPRQRSDSPSPMERQPSRRRRSVKMQRSSSHVGVVPSSAAAAYAHYQQQQYYPWSVKLDRSSASLKGSECGSTSSVLTAATTVGYCRSLVGFEVHKSQLY